MLSTPWEKLYPPIDKNFSLSVAETPESSKNIAQAILISQFSSSEVA